MASTSNTIFLMNKSYNLKMKEGGNISNHLNEFNTLIGQLILVNINLDDEMKSILLLCSLLNSCEGFVMVVSNLVSSKNRYVLKFDDVGILLSEDMRRKNQGTSSGDTLVTDSRWRP